MTRKKGKEREGKGR